MIVYVTIGNSDDKLEQRQWSAYCAAVNSVVDQAESFGSAIVHGRWYSLPNERWQNACWCLEFRCSDEVVGQYSEELARLARVFRQDSVAWSEATTTLLRSEP